MKRENRIIEIIIDPAAQHSHRLGAQDEKTDTGMARSESKQGLPDPREEEMRSEKRRGDKKRLIGNRNVSVNVHVNANVKHRGNGRLRRLVNRRVRLKDEDRSDENRSCNKKEMVSANWKKNEFVRENNVSVKEPK